MWLDAGSKAAEDSTPGMGKSVLFPRRRPHLHFALLAPRGMLTLNT